MTNQTDRIKELLRILHVPEGMEVTARQTGEGRIQLSVDGEYFDTYDSAADRLTDGNMRFVPQSMEPESRITAIIADRSRLDRDKGVTLSFPASESEIADALQRARTTEENAGILWCEVLHQSFYADSPFALNSRIRELNHLSYRLEALDDASAILVKGQMAQAGSEDFSAAKVIDMTYNLDECQIAYTIKNLRELGEFVMGQNLYPELRDLPPQVAEYMDCEKIGERFHKEKQGIFLEEGYFYNDAEDCQKVYDEAAFLCPADSYFFRVKVSKRPQEMDDEPGGIWIGLPTDSEVLDTIRRAIGVDSWADCSLCGVQSILPDMQYCISDPQEMEALNNLAENIALLGTVPGQQEKYKAMLEASQCRDIQLGMDLLEHLEDFTIWPEYASLADYGKKELTEVRDRLTPDMERFFDFDGYASEKLQNQHIHPTRYGILKQNNLDYTFISAPEEPQP